MYKAHLLPEIKLDSKSSCCPLPQTVAVKTLKGTGIIITCVVDIIMLADKHKKHESLL